MSESPSRFVGSYVSCYLGSIGDFCYFEIMEFITEPDDQCYYKVRWEDGRISFINTTDVCIVDQIGKPALQTVSYEKVVSIGSRKTVSAGKA